MNKNLTQKDRIIQFIDKQGISKNKFYNQTGVSNGTLDKKSGITGETIAKIYTAYPEINLEWLISGEGEMIKSSLFWSYDNLQSVREQYAAVMNIDPATVSDKNLLKAESPLEFIPIFSYKGSHKCHGYLSIPNLSSCDGAGFVKTDSMYPLIKPGDIVCYKTANHTNDIYWGEMYIIYLTIDGEEFLTIKNLDKSDIGDDFIRLSGYNQKYHPKDVPINRIQWKAIVKACINYNSVI
ncbi:MULTISPECIES: S24 family peptidase [Dysgonomonas]|uniref:S24 family peptidase n=1 Tax=Dysgonomonas TaxID=156973 RepID=UPI001884467A|nr:LexA family transcriptional regulator [Dysgonomonas sp. GY75]MBF0648092.1 LexA family transcriptional regulator [Dysgonomonas sp. GY75]